jgi:hypothetical protein
MNADDTDREEELPRINADRRGLDAREAKLLLILVPAKPEAVRK